MKEGDKYFCIKTLIVKEYKNSALEELFTKGKFYEIAYINNYDKYQCSVHSHNLNEWGGYKDFTFTIVKGGKYYFEDYFANIRKLRKIKINKINEQQ